MGNLLQKQMMSQVSQVANKSAELPWLTNFLSNNKRFNQISSNIHSSKLNFVDKIFESLNQASFEESKDKTPIKVSN